MADPLFQTNTKYTFEEYKKCIWYAQNLNKLRMLIIIISFLLSILAIMEFILHNIKILLLSASTAVLLPIFIITVLKIVIRKGYYSNKALQNLETKILFYDNYLENSNEAGFYKLNYDDIYKIIETDTNFYILISTVQVVVIVKENCSAQLIEFIKKLKEK